MTDVSLVLMPYAAVERPSLALGLLKAALQEQGIKAQVFYPNLWFAEEIGIYKYKIISESLFLHLMAEWTFAGAAFPDFIPDEQEYFRTINYQKQDVIQEILSVRKRAAKFVDKVAENILQSQPKIVACSSSFHQHCASLAVLRRIREINPEIITIMGGSNCEGVMGLVTHQAFPWVDFVCSGEGDEMLPKLCKKLLEIGKDVAINELPYGVIAPAHRGKLPPDFDSRASVENLDQIPIPDFDDYFLALAKCQKILPYIDAGMMVETARGCWWGQKKHCTFCGLNGDGMTYRSKSPERVVNELNLLANKYNLFKFFVVDNILDINHINTVLPAVAKINQKYSLFYETKSNLKRNQVEQLAKAGVRWMQPGIEAMHDDLLKLMNKGNSALINVQILKWGRQFGIQTLWNFLLSSPGEKWEWYAEILTWLPMIFHLQPPMDVRPIGYTRFSLYHEKPENYGLTLVPKPAYRYIYPLSEEMIKQIAYFFDDINPGLSFPEHKDLEILVNEWRSLFFSEKPPNLTIVADDGTSLEIIDTRPCAVNTKICLTGLAYQVYLLCEQALGFGELLFSLREKYQREINRQEVEQVVQELANKKILLYLNNRMLSLALSMPVPPLQKETEQPGGKVDVPRYIRDTERQFLQLFQKKIST